VVIRTKELQKQAEKLHFTQRQAQAILELRLSRLIGLEILELEKEHKKTVKNIKTYKKILSDGNTMKETIKNDLIAIRDRYGVERKTSILQAQEVVIKKVERKPQKLVFLMDRFGYAKTLDEKLYQKYGEEQLKEYRYSCPCMSNGKIQIFTEGARLHQVKVSEIPQTKLKDKGVPIDNLSTYDSTMEQILYVRSVSQLDEELPCLIFVTTNGLIKKTESSEFITNNRNVVATKLLEEDELVYVGENVDSQIVLISEKGYFLRFTTDEIPTMKKNSQGSKGMELVASDKIFKVYAVTPQENAQLALSEEKTIALDRIRLKKRGEKGIKLRK
jgi:DNA gyrase subunit A